MRVTIDARVAAIHPFGIARYARLLLEHLRAHPGIDPVAIFDREPGALREELAGIEVCVVPAARPEIYWEQAVLAKALRRLRPDLHHALHNTGVPVLAPCPSVVTIHDLIPWLRPWASTSRRARIHYRSRLLIALRAASAVIAVSEHTRSDLIRLAGADGAKVHVVPQGVEPRFRPPGAEAARIVGERYGLATGAAEGYFVCVAYPRPHKNLERLVEAYGCLPEGVRRAFRLVLAGCSAGHLETVLGRQLGAEERERIRALGFVPDEDLPALLGAARAFVFPSLYEGFGLPVLEALACGVPVICSDRTALPEVAGDAVLLVDPDSAADLSRAMGRLAADPALCRDLAARGRARAAAFSWQRTTAETVAIYERVLGRSLRLPPCSSS
jgi:alpha-1,3-rhamnosyl/mannosyltransferase